MTIERASSANNDSSHLGPMPRVSSPTEAGELPASRQYGSITTRIDSPHVVHGPPPVAPVPSLELAAAASGHPPSPADRELLERHAQRITERLRQTQRELDERESEFHARIAQFEAESRSVRLQLAEQRSALEQRERSLEEQARTLSERSADLAAAEWSQHAQEPSVPLPDSGAAQELRFVVSLWRDKIRELDIQERQLQAQAADLASDRKQLASEQLALLSERSHQQAILDQERAQLRGIREQQSQEFLLRSQALDRRQEAVSNMHADLSRLYRETIETQLCTEQLWARITEQQPSTELALKMAELRATLADEYRLAADHLAQEHGQLKLEQQQLRQENQHLQAQRSELRDWFHRQQQQLEQQTRQLLQREQELAQKEHDLKFATHQWEEQRRQSEQEIRRLKRLVRVA